MNFQFLSLLVCLSSSSSLLCWLHCVYCSWYIIIYCYYYWLFGCFVLVAFSWFVFSSWFADFERNLQRGRTRCFSIILNKLRGRHWFKEEDNCEIIDPKKLRNEDDLINGWWFAFVWVSITKFSLMYVQTRGKLRKPYFKCQLQAISVGLTALKITLKSSTQQEPLHTLLGDQKQTKTSDNNANKHITSKK